MCVVCGCVCVVFSVLFVLCAHAEHGIVADVLAKDFHLRPGHQQVLGAYLQGLTTEGGGKCIQICASTHVI
jgi:hypothetical protein